MEIVQKSSVPYNLPTPTLFPGDKLGTPWGRPGTTRLRILRGESEPGTAYRAQQSGGVRSTGNQSPSEPSNCLKTSSIWSRVNRSIVGAFFPSSSKKQSRNGKVSKYLRISCLVVVKYKTPWSKLSAEVLNTNPPAQQSKETLQCLNRRAERQLSAGSEQTAQKDVSVLEEWLAHAPPSITLSCSGQRQSSTGALHWWGSGVNPAASLTVPTRSAL